MRKQDRWLEADAEYASALGQSCGSASTQAPPGTAVPSPAKRFIPFSDGPRDCIGRTLAHMNIIAALAALLANFQFSLAASVRQSPAQQLLHEGMRGPNLTVAVCPQMGGPQGVRSKERLLSTLQIDGGMKMHAMPRGS